MLYQLQLKNFKTHRERTVTFNAGLNAIQGPNAVGKSNLLKGVLFALFGARAAGATDHLPTWGCNDTEVTLDLELPQYGRVTVSRSLRNAKVRQGDTLLAAGITPVRALIEEAFGMDSNALQTLLVSRQGESQALLALGPAALQALIEKLARFDRVDQVLQMLSTDIAEDNGRVSEFGPLQDLELLAQELKSLEREEKHWAELQEYHEHRCDELQQLVVTLQPEKQAAEEVLNQRPPLEADLRAGMAQLHTLQQTLAEEEARLQTMESDTLEERVQAAEAAAQAAQQALSEATTAWASAHGAQQRREMLLRELETVEAQVDSTQRVEEPLRAAQHAIAQAEQDYEALNEAWRVALLERGYAEKAVRDAVCGTCKRPFSDTDMAVANARLEQARAAAELAQQQEQAAAEHLGMTRKRVRTLEAQYYPHAATRLAQLQADLPPEQALEPLQQARRHLEVQARDTQTEALQLKALWTQAQELRNRVELYRSRVTEAQALVAQKQAQLDALPLAWQCSEVLTRFNALRQELRVEDGNLIDAKHQRQQFRAELARLEARADEARAQHERYQSLKQRLHARKSLQTWLRQSRATISAELWDDLLSYTSQLLRATTMQRLGTVEREGTDLYVYEHEQRVPVSDLSGFQRSLLGLALRVALSRVFFGQEHVLLLDEPTADASEENSARVAGLLQALGSQVIFVTHRESDAANAPTVIRLDAQP
jgi:DNA repair exonuclease SbcCD ATPase subunit